MSKAIWFFNHYSQPIEYYPHERTFQYASKMINQGYNAFIFCSSTVHNSNINLSNSKERFFVTSSSNINYIVLKTRNYKGNGISRVFNMLEYTIKLFLSYKKIQRPELIVATSVHPFACYAAIKIARKLKVKCVIEIADLWPESIVAYGLASKKNLFVRFLYLLEKYIYTKSDILIFTMRGGLDYIENQKNLSHITKKNKIHTINNGVDLDKFDFNSKNYIYTNPSYTTPSSFKVVYTGSLGEANQIFLILKTAKLVSAFNANISFFLFGDGPQIGEIRSYVIDNNLNNVFLMGKVDRKYIPSILIQSDLNVITIKESSIIKYGMSPNKLFEYAASGKPILVNCESSYDLIKEFNCGVISKSNNPDGLAQSILDIKNMNEVEYKKISYNARKMAEYFDYKNTTQRFSEIIAKLLKK
jgi:glycosyltransferase involved in cell wall biosynthesis